MCAAAWNFDVADDADNEDDITDYRRLHEAAKDCLIVLLDCRQSMLDERCDFGLGGGPMCALQTCFKAVQNYTCQKCCGGTQDHVAVLLLNTEKTKNEDNFAHIYEMQPCAVPGAGEVNKLAAYADSRDFAADLRALCGDPNVAAAQNTSAVWHEAFWLAQLTADRTEVHFGTRRVLILSDDGEPHGADPTVADKVHKKAADLRDQGWSVELIAPTAHFDGQLFWNGALDPKNVSRGADSFDELMSNIRRKDYKRRSAGNIRFKLGDGVEMAISLFNLVLETRKPTAMNLDRFSNEQVKTLTTYFNEETGEKLLDRDLRKAQVYAGTEVLFESAEVEHMRRLESPGVALLGFKPLTMLKDYYHVRPVMFAYPDDKSVHGSTSLYRALLSRCSARGMFALCRLTARANMPPRLVALVPQEEVKDEKGQREQSAGFNVVYLPYSDDLRRLADTLARSTADDDSGSEPKPKLIREGDMERAAAEKLVNKLSIKYHPELYSNPALAKHYGMLEKLALDSPAAAGAFVDHTKPDAKAMERVAASQLDAFCSLVFPAGYEPASTAAAKRKAPTAGDGAKRAKTVDVAGVDLEQEAKDGKLSKYTVAQLKQMAADKNVRLAATKKADIIKEIQDALT